MLILAFLNIEHPPQLLILVNGTTNSDGEVYLPVRTGIITSDTEQFVGYIQLSSEYNDKKGEEISRTLTQDATITLKIDSVNQNTGDGDGFELPGWLMVVIVILVVLLLAFGGGYIYYTYIYN